VAPGRAHELIVIGIISTPQYLIVKRSNLFGHLRSKRDLNAKQLPSWKSDQGPVGHESLTADGIAEYQ
jgi:hypothetical protein